MPRPATTLDTSLTRANLLALAVLCVLGAAGLAWQMSGRAWFVESPAVDRPRVRQAQEKIDPNTAGVASLRRLPGIGEVRARDIVQYRDEHGPGAFKSANDLREIPGIGKGTVKKISPFLAPPDTWRDDGK